MPILHPQREAAKLVLCGFVILGAGIYTIRTGSVGQHLQRFQLLGWRRRYTHAPQPLDRRMYQVFGSIGVLIGLAAIGFGVHTLVAR